MVCAVGAALLSLSAYSLVAPAQRARAARNPSTLHLQEPEPAQPAAQQGSALDPAAAQLKEELADDYHAVALHPQDADSHIDLAQALLTAGFGAEARTEAQRAVALYPRSSEAYQALGWVLEHDAVGRRFQKGFDLAGAVAAYRKAAEVDPANTEARGNLAILLEHDAQGVRYAPDADMAGAIAEYQSLELAFAKTEMQNNILFAYMWAGRFKELRDTAQKMSPTPERQALTLVADAVLSGPAVAVDAASQDIPGEEPRRKALLQAGNQLLKLRYYPQAADLLAASAQGSDESDNTLSRVAVIRNTRRYEDVPLPANDPRTVVRNLFITLMVRPESAEESLPKLYSHRAWDLAKADLQNSSDIKDLQRVLRVVRSTLAKLGLTPAGGADLALGNLQMSVEGDDAQGYRIRVQGVGPSGTQDMVAFAVREGGEYRLASFGADYAELGNEALADLNTGNLSGARHWLDWAREEEHLGGGDDPFDGPVFPRLWEKGSQGDGASIRYAAASLLASDEPAAKLAVEPLQQGLKQASSDAARHNFDLALAQAYIATRDFKDELPLAQELLKASPDSDVAFSLAWGALLHLQRWQEGEQVANERLKRRPGDLEAIRALISAAEAQGHFERARELGLQLVSAGKAESLDYNNLAWDALMNGTVTGQAVDEAQRAVTLAQNTNPYALHTLAAIKAEQGNVTEARETLLQYLDVSGLDEPDEAAWYVFGRIAEQLGLLDAAASDYRKLKPPEDPAQLANSTYMLAERRLKAIQNRQSGMKNSAGSAPAR